MTETIKLMKAHTSVRRFKEQEIPLLLCDCGTKSREERCLV